MKEIVRKFLNSIYFIILINGLGLIFWYTKQPIYSYISYLLAFILVIIFNARRIVVVSLILNGLIGYRVVSTPEFEKLYKTNLIVFTTLTIICVAIVTYDLFFRRKVKLNLKNKIFLGWVVLAVGNLLSIVNATKNTLLMIVMGFLQIIAFLIIFIFIDHLKDETSDDYFSQSAIITGISITIQIFIHLLKEPDSYQALFYSLGWGNRNTISIMYMCLIPLVFYPYFKDQRKIYGIIFSGVFFVMTLLMLSRGAYLTIALLFIPFMVLSFRYINDKKKYIKDMLFTIIISISLAAAIIFGLDKQQYFYDHIASKIKNIFYSADRLKLIKIGFNVFKKYPIFGGGSFTGAYYLQVLNESHVATYHNYIIHALATTGLVGFGSFIYYLYSIFYNLRTRHKFNFCVFFVMLVLLIHGLFDNTFYNPLFMIFLSILLPMIKTKEEAQQLINEND